MKKRTIIGISLIAGILLISVISGVVALFKSKANPNTQAQLAAWNVHLDQTGVSNTLTVVPNLRNETYTLNITNDSEVDVRYTIVISNLPSGVEVSLDSGTFRTPTNNTISFADVGTILYTDTDKTNSHTLTFKANTGATPVDDQEVTIRVIVKQIV